MFYLHKAYLSSKGGPAVLNLTHDVKRCLADSKAKSGHINIISTRGTIGVALMENDQEIQQEFLGYAQGWFVEGTAPDLPRRSKTGSSHYHHMASLTGLSLTLAFENGHLLTSSFHDIIALDFEPAGGRREFIMAIQGEGDSDSKQPAGSLPR